MSQSNKQNLTSLLVLAFRALLLHFFIPNLTGNQVYFKVLSYSLSQSLIIHLWQYIYQKNRISNRKYVIIHLLILVKVKLNQQ